MGESRLRGRSRRCARRSGAATSTRSISSSTWSAPSRRGADALAAGSALRAATLAGDGWAIVSASPELFLARRGRRVWTAPIKGRGRSASTSRAKDAAEHVMIVDLERNDLSRVCEPGSVRWPELMAERELAGVTHLVSTVEGTLREEVGLAELLAATFPGGSVTGAPKIAALDLIAGARAGRPRCVDGRARRRPRQRRPRPRADDPHVRDRGGADPPLGRRRHRLGLGARGRDRGVVDEGAAAAGGDRRARRGEREQEGRLLAVAVGGRGVVDPVEPVLRADDEALLRGRAAFETIRVYGGRPFKLAEHLDRLAGSAERIGLPEVNRLELEELAQQALDAAGAPGRRPPPLLDADPVALALVSGSPTTTRELRERGQRLISLRGVRADEPWLLPGVKSTSYAVNMAAEAEAKRQGADDAVFVDAEATVLEGPTTNVWWRRERTLFTPSLDLGILAGVTRATVLELAGAGYTVEEGHFGLTELLARTRPSRPRRCAR